MSAAALIEKLDDHGKAAWVAVLVFSFIVFWPAGLALLAYLIWSGRMGCWGHHAGGDRWPSRMDRLQAKMERMHEKANRWYGRHHQQSSSGNRAFDDYRDETLRRPASPRPNSEAMPCESAQICRLIIKAGGRFSLGRVSISASVALRSTATA